MSSSKISQDILSNPMFQGTQDSIQWILNWTQSGFGVIISSVAFLIILVAILKNVMAGLYCTYPKFFDKVDAVHRENEGTGWIARIQGLKTSYASINGGSVIKFFLGIIPNIKALTDFEDTQVAAKDYFMRAIPAGLAAICIGAFIYNGHYRDLAARVTDFGSEVLSRTLLSFDPIEAYDNITASAGRPEFSTDKATDKRDKLYNQISVDMYNKIISSYPDIKDKKSKAHLAQAIESKVDAAFAKDTEAATLAGDDDWTASVETAKVVGSHDYSKVNKYDTAKNRYTFRFEDSMADFNLNSARYNDDKDTDPYLQVSISFRFTPVQSGAVTLFLQYDEMPSPVNIQPYGYKFIDSKTVSIGNKPYKVEGNVLTFNSNSSSDMNTKLESGVKVHGLWIELGGKKYEITEIRKGPSGLYAKSGSIVSDKLTSDSNPADAVKDKRSKTTETTQE
jgi:hypothetical protein